VKGGGAGVVGVGWRGAAEARDDVVTAGDWRVLVRLFGWMVPYRRLVAVQLVLMAATGLLQVAQPLLVKHAIDVAIPAGLTRVLAACALGFLGLSLLELLARYGSLLATMLTGQGVVRDLRKAVFTRTAWLDQATFDRTPVGRLMVRATSDVEALEELFSQGVVSAVGDVLRMALLLAVMLALDVRLTLVALAATPVFVLASAWFGARIRAAYRAVRARTSRLNAFLVEQVMGVRVVRLFGQEAREERRFLEHGRDLLREDLGSVWHDSVYSAVVEMLGTLATAAIAWHGGGEVVQGAVSFGTLFVFLSYAQQFFAPLQDVSMKYAVLQSAMASAERVFALLDQPDHVRSPDPATAPPVPAPRGALSFEGVTFAYGDDPDVLHDVSFDVAPGSRVALVGATGSGKTTITRLVNRLHDVRTGSGTVRLDGLDVRDYPLDVLRRRVGVVLQEPVLFSGTVRDNLFAEGDDARAWAALEAVHAAGFVRRLGGLDAALRERGGNLSVGERQLLTLARALLYDPVVLILDEATAAVDSLTERALQEAMERVMAGRTCLVVAHRLSTVRDADEILVFHHGRLRERGRHAELLARRGIYERLWRLGLREG
jgi:ATP-binding cassette subfamily B protein